MTSLIRSALLSASAFLSNLKSMELSYVVFLKLSSSSLGSYLYSVNLPNQLKPVLQAENAPLKAADAKPVTAPVIAPVTYSVVAFCSIVFI